MFSAERSAHFPLKNTPREFKVGAWTSEIERKRAKKAEKIVNRVWNNCCSSIPRLMLAQIFHAKNCFTWQIFTELPTHHSAQ